MEEKEPPQAVPCVAVQCAPSTLPAPSITAFKVREKYGAGVRLMQNGYVLAAIQQFREASFFNAEDALPIVALAECYVFLCDLRSAIRCYRRALWSLHKRKERSLLIRKYQSETFVFAEDDASLHPRLLSSLVTRESSHAAVQPVLPPPPPPPPQPPATVQFSPTVMSLSDEVLHTMEDGRHVPEDSPPREEIQESPKQAAEVKQQMSWPLQFSNDCRTVVEAPLSPSSDSSSSTDNGSPRRTVSLETVFPQVLTTAEVRIRLAGVLDALSLALFQVGSVEQALRCTTEALELHDAAAAEEEEEMTQAGGDSKPAVLGLFRKLPNPYLSEPTIALHRGVFLIALQREEEAEILLGKHYEMFEDFRVQSAPLLIQLYCNRQAFRKARLLLESHEERLQSNADAPGEGRTWAKSEEGAPAAAAAGTWCTDIREGSPSACLTHEDVKPEDATEDLAEQPGAPAAVSPSPAPLSLTVAKYIFTELYARYRSAALASDDEDSVTRCLDVYPNDIGLLFRRAQLRIAAGELKLSIKDLFRCVRDTNGEHKEAIESMTTVLFTIGSSLDGESEMQNAVSYYSESLKWRPDNVLVLLARGDCYTKLESFQDALADYQVVLNYVPDHPQALGRIAALHDLWGRKFFALDNAAEAEAEFTNAIKTDSRNPEFYYHRALCRLKLNQGEYALRDVLSCKELNPSAPHLRAFIARYMEPVQRASEAGKEEGRSITCRTITTRPTPADSNRQTPSVKPNAAAKWYGARTLPSTAGYSARGKVTSRTKRSDGSVRYATPLPSSRSALTTVLPPLSTHSTPARGTTVKGWMQGFQTLMHRRQGEAVSQTK